MDINPLKAERVQLNLTQAQLAKYADMSQNAIVKFEHGLYAEPSSSIISALFRVSLTRFQVSSSDFINYRDLITVAYKKWRVNKIRAARSVIFKGRQYGSLPRPVGLHPFADWRINYLGVTSQMELCKLLCLHPSILSQYESGRTFSMPHEIKFALNACDLPEITIEALEIESQTFAEDLSYV